jgi:hypothetical protein
MMRAWITHQRRAAFTSRERRPGRKDTCSAHHAEPSHPSTQGETPLPLGPIVKRHEMPNLDFEGCNTLLRNPWPSRLCYEVSAPARSLWHPILLQPRANGRGSHGCSGTTIVESRLLGRHCGSFDIDSLAHLIADLKSTPLDDAFPRFQWVKGARSRAEIAKGWPPAMRQFPARSQSCTFWLWSGVWRNDSAALKTRSSEAANHVRVRDLMQYEDCGPAIRADEAAAAEAHFNESARVDVD